MLLVTRISELRAQVLGWRRQGHKVALVPTMGNLHPGHVALVGEARRHGERTVVSIFVNPMQFGPNEDFARYPRTLEDDKRLLEQADANLLFHPDTAEIYPLGHERNTIVDVPDLSGILCGAFRPGHFAGVATVVVKLLNIVQPDVALFGEKDYQQLMIIRRSVVDLCLPVEIVGVPTMRDLDGLALSSRNRYLTPDERVIAPQLFQALEAARKRVEAGDRQFEQLEKEGVRSLERAGFRPDYFAIRHAADLQPPGSATREFVILTAARLGRARLIDNVKATV